jgi:hypothetical protein
MMIHRKSVSIENRVDAVNYNKNQKYSVYLNSPKQYHGEKLGSFRLKKNAEKCKKQFIAGRKKRGTW